LTTDDAMPSAPWLLYVLGAAGLLAAGVVAVTRYPSLPADYPNHWGFDGMPTQWAPKSLMWVLSPVIIGAVLLFVALVATWAMSRLPVRRHPDGDRVGPKARQDVRLQSAVTGVGWTAAWAALLLSALTLVVVLGGAGTILQVVLGVGLVASLLPLLVVLRNAGTGGSSTGGMGSESADHDAHWD